MIAIYNKKEETLDYYYLAKCDTSAVIKTRYELVSKGNYDLVYMNDLDNEDIVINKKDLVKIIKELDKEVDRLQKELEK